MPKPARVPSAFKSDAMAQARKANNPLLYYHLAQWHLANGRVKAGLGLLEEARKANLRYVDQLSRPRFSAHVPAVVSAISGREKQFTAALRRLPQEILFIRAMPNWEISAQGGALQATLPEVSKTQRQLSTMMTGYAHYSAFTDEYTYRQMVPSGSEPSQPPAELLSPHKPPSSLEEVLKQMRQRLSPSIKRTEKREKNLGEQVKGVFTRAGFSEEHARALALLVHHEDFYYHLYNKLRAGRSRK